MEQKEAVLHNDHARTLEAYRSFVVNETSQKLGLYDEDVIRLMDDEEVLYVEHIDKDGGITKLPMLVPVEKLYWWNRPAIEKRLGLAAGSDIFYYTHTPLPLQDAKYTDALQGIIKNGGTIVTDVLNGFGTDGLDTLVNKLGVKPEIITGNLGPKSLNQFTGIVDIKGSSGYVETDDLASSYRDGVMRGKFEYDIKNGPAIESVLNVDDALRFWEVYDQRLSAISVEHPFNASYAKEDFLELMQNPDVVKMVYRVNGEIATLCLLINSLKDANWLNADYYEKVMPDAVRTHNLFVFLGVVSDPKLQGKDSHSLTMMGLMTEVAQYRGSNTVITFECNDVSSRYVPKIVKTAINLSGAGVVTGLDAPESQLTFVALSSHK